MANRATRRIADRTKNRFELKENKIELEIANTGKVFTLNLDDVGVYDRVLTLYSKYSTIKDTYLEELTKIEGIVDEFERKVAIAKITIKLSTDFVADINTTFGADTCEIVFGKITPSLTLISQFFETLKPCIDNYVKEKKAIEVQKLTGRTGNIV